MKLSQEEKRLMVGALSYAIASAPTTTIRHRYLALRKKTEQAIRNNGLDPESRRAMETPETPSAPEAPEPTPETPAPSEPTTPAENPSETEDGEGDQEQSAAAAS